MIKYNSRHLTVKSLKKIIQDLEKMGFSAKQIVAMLKAM